MSFTVPQFAKDAAERAAKTFAQAALAVLGANQVDIVHTNWVGILSVAGGAAVVSILTSVASGARADTMSPASMLKAAPADAPVCPMAQTTADLNAAAAKLAPAAQDMTADVNALRAQIRADRKVSATAAALQPAVDQTAQAVAVAHDLAATVAPAVFVTPVSGGNVVTTTTVPAVPVGNALAPISHPGDTTTAAP